MKRTLRLLLTSLSKTNQPELDTLIKSSFMRGDYSSILEKFDFSRSTNIKFENPMHYCYTYCALNAGDRNTECDSIFNEMKENQFFDSLEIINHLLNSNLQTSRHIYSKLLIGYVLVSSLTPSQQFYDMSLKVVSQTHDTNLLDRIHESLNRQSSSQHDYIGIYEVMIQVYHDFEKFLEMNTVYKHCLRIRKCSAVIYRVMLKFNANRNNFDGFTGIFSSMLENGLEADVESFPIVIEYYTKSDPRFNEQKAYHLHIAYQIYLQAKPELFTLAVFEKLILFYCDRLNVKIAQKLRENMSHLGIEMSPTIISTLIRTYYKIFEFDTVVELFNTIEEDFMIPTDFPTKELFELSNQLNDLEFTYRLTTMVSRPIFMGDSNIKTTLEMCILTEKKSEFLKHADELLSTSLSVDMLRILHRGSIHFSDQVMIDRCFVGLETSGHIEMSDFADLMIYYVMQWNLDGFNEIHDKWAQSGLKRDKIYYVALYCYWRRVNLGKADRLFEHLTFVPDRQVLEQILPVLIGDKDHARVMTIHRIYLSASWSSQQMNNLLLGFHLSVEGNLNGDIMRKVDGITSGLIVVLCNAERISGSVDLMKICLEKLKRSTMASYLSFLVIYREIGTDKQVCEFLKEMKRLGHLNREILYEIFRLPVSKKVSHTIVKLLRDNAIILNDSFLLTHYLECCIEIGDHKTFDQVFDLSKKGNIAIDASLSQLLLKNLALKDEVHEFENHFLKMLTLYGVNDEIFKVTCDYFESTNRTNTLASIIDLSLKLKEVLGDDYFVYLLNLYMRKGQYSEVKQVVQDLTEIKTQLSGMILNFIGFYNDEMRKRKCFNDIIVV